MGEFANLMDPNIDTVPKKSAKTAQSGDILNLNFGNSNPTKPSKSTKKTAHEEQIDAQQEKLNFANEIDPICLLYTSPSPRDRG